MDIDNPKQKVDSSAQLDWEETLQGFKTSMFCVLRAVKSENVIKDHKSRVNKLFDLIPCLLNEAREKERADLMEKFDNLLNILKSGL